MLKNDYATQNCSVARALESVGERWTLLIVRQLLRRPHRFAELQKILGIAKNILAARLDKLVELEIVERRPLTDTRDWNEYSLTRKGYDLTPVISALMAWGDKYEAPNGPPTIFVHECGHDAGHRVVCQHCGEPPRHGHLVPGPGADERTPLS